MGFEKCSRVFESPGFLTPSSLKYLLPGDVDAFIPSPEKLLLAEKPILESEIKEKEMKWKKIYSFFLCPYSPRLNTSEHCFHQIKEFLRRCQMLAIEETEIAIAEGVSLILADNSTN